MKQLALICLVLLCVHCKSRTAASGTTAGSATASDTTAGCRGLTHAYNDSLYTETPVHIAYASLSGDCLEIRVSYSGCRKGEALLVWTGAVMKSMPPQVPLSLKVTNTGACDMLLSETFFFDISELRNVSSRGEVIIRLNGLRENLRYTY